MNKRKFYSLLLAVSLLLLSMSLNLGHAVASGNEPSVTIRTYTCRAGASGDRGRYSISASMSFTVNTTEGRVLGATVTYTHRENGWYWQGGSSGSRAFGDYARGYAEGEWWASWGASGEIFLTMEGYPDGSCRVYLSRLELARCRRVRERDSSRLSAAAIPDDEIPTANCHACILSLPPPTQRRS